MSDEAGRTDAQLQDKRARLARLLAEEARRHPLSFAQQRLWFLDQIAPGGSAYNIAQAFRLRGDLNREALESSLAAVVARQAGLRTTFTSVEGRAVQVVGDGGWAGLTHVDLRGVEAAQRERWAEQRAGEEAERPFDLGAGPLFRGTLLRLQEQDHLLLLAMHHIVSDGWSMGVLLRELRALYASRVGGAGSPLPELAIQYVDFAVWQREWLQGERLDRLLGYWREQLSGLVATGLPTDRARPAIQSFLGWRREVGLGRELTDALKSFSSREGVTLFMTLLAGLQALLARYAGQTDVVVGSPVANRTRRELEGLIGFFVNALVLRTDLSGDPSFRELLRRVRGVALGAYSHQDLPFERLVDELEAERSLDRNPLFQIAFAFQNTPAEPLELPGVLVSPLPLDRTRSKLDLTLSLQEGVDGLEGFIEYSTDLFDAATIERFLGHYLRLLEAAVASPGGRLSELTVVGGVERRRLLEEWNRTEREYPEAGGIGKLFEKQARLRPDAVAVVFGEDRLSYGELDVRSNRLARYLRKRGVVVGTRVGICAERSLELMVGLLGIVKAGGVYVPLDPEYPQERLEFMVEDSEIELLLTQERLVGRAGSGTEVLCLDRELEGIGEEEGSAVESGVGLEDLAYVTYTSGSTGVPKGVEVRHRGVVRLLFGVEYAEFGAAEVFLQLAPVTFDASTLEIWGALLHGGRCVLYPERVPTVLGLGEVVKREGVTTLWLTASLYNAVIDEAPETLLGVKQLLIGGEALSVAHVKRGYAHLKETRIINGYGPTEGTTFTCCYAIPRDVGEVRSIPIGVPIGNTRVYVLDGKMEVVPVGVAGELYIGGAGLGRGYLKRPVLTAERFRPDPFSCEAGARLYQTGDLVRYQSDGNLEFLGRIDQQVKVRGYRIELGEIETVLGEHPAVVRCAVVAREEGSGTRRLVAYVVGGDGGGSLVSDLKIHLRSKLPEHMVPAAFVVLDELPLSPNGKIDHAALGRLEVPALGGDAPAWPATEVETRLSEIWREVLGLDRVGLHQNFFELGGDSILSIQLTARANRAGLRVTPQQLFQNQTISELAAVVEPIGGLVPSRMPETGAIPLTPIQHWFFELGLPDPNHFNQWVLLEAREALDPAMLDRALRHLVEHHDALRLRYRSEGAEWQQVQAGSLATPELVQLDLTGMPEVEQGAGIERLAGDIHGGLNLASGPVWRAALVRRGGGRSDLVLLVAHHLVVDGVSWRILVEDLEAAYRQLAHGDAVRLPARTTSFQEWARRLSEHGRSEAPRRDAAFWLDHARIGRGSLPVERPEGPDQNDFASLRRVSAWLDEGETSVLLREVPKAYGTQVDETLLAALAPVIARWTGEPTLLVDIERHGREEIFDGVDLSRTVGWFTTIHPVRIELEAEEIPHRALTKVKEQLRSVPGRGLSYGVLRYLGGDPNTARSLREQARAELSFNYLGQFDQALGSGGLLRFSEGAEPLGLSARGARPYLLGITARITGGRLRLDWSYSEEAHRGETIEGLARDHLEALRSLIRHCQAPGAGGYTPSDFPLARLDQAALDRLLGAERGVEAVYPFSPMQEGMLFHSLLAPESVAYFVQMTQVLEGALDVASFKVAWEQTAMRHPVLRSAFLWQGLAEPLQVVWREIALPCEEHDWSQAGEDQHSRLLREFLEADRRRRVDFTKAPAWRLSLIRLGPEAHRVVWSFHHVLLDGWSLPVVLNEVFERYEALRQGRRMRATSTRPYQDFISWLREQDQAPAEAFWRRTLSGFNSPTALRLDQPRLSASEERYEEHELRLGRDLAEALQALARGHQVTLNALLQGAWAVLLGRYSGRHDVVFGATVSGRPAELPGVESMVGLFINTLPVRVELSESDRLAAFLQRLHRSQLEMLQYQHSSLAQVQRWSDVREGEALFESILLFENYPEVGSLWRQEGSLRVREARGYDESNYPLTVVVVPRDGLWVRIKRDCRRFEGAAVERMLGHFRRLLEGMAARPDSRLGELSLLEGHESRQLIVEWNDTRTRYPQDQGVHRLFEAQVERTPAVEALVFGDERLSYEELNTRANRLARHLLRLGIGPDAKVGLCLERSAAMVVGMLAVLKAGGAYVPLDPSYPQERLAYMLRDAGVRLVLTQESLRAQVAPGSRTLLCIDSDSGAIAEESAQNLIGVASGDALAYVIYTSGSTGEPKGVGVPHRAIARLVCNTDYVPLAGEVVAQASNASFDAATFEVWGPLLNGGRLVGITREATLSPRQFAEELREHRITVLFVTTALFNLLAREAPGAFSGLSSLLFGGEAVDPRCVSTVLGNSPPQRLLHVYGPTESTTFATYHHVTQVAADAVTVPIGRPIANTTTYVLDGSMNLVPVGLVGELFIGGEGLARGYLNRPDATAERFVPNPFASEGGARLYRTGDRVRQCGDGSIEFLGRVDNQVKLRGFRIELGEVEGCLNRHPAVHDAVVVVREDEPGDRRLVAYVVWRSQEAVAVGTLRAYLARELPDHMVPSTFCTLEALPLNPNGKVDRNALPAPEGQAFERGEAFVAPRGPIEEILAGIFEEVLGAERVGAHDDFFELGGHSLRATQVVSRIRAALGVEPPLRRLFESPTVAGIAAFVEEERQRREGAALIAAPWPRPRASRPPLSFAQQRLWFLDQLEGASPTYNVPAAFRLKGALDGDALARAFEEIQRRHDVMRTCFPSEGGVPAQQVAPSPRATLLRIDLTGRPPGALESECQRLVKEEAERPFDLARGPLLRGVLIRLSESEHVLCLVMHHVISDGWSMGLFVRELEVLYGAFGKGLPSPLDNLEIQYADFAAWQREQLQGSVLESQLSYWKGQLDGSPATITFPTDRPRPRRQSFRGGRQSVRLPLELSAALRAFSRREGVTLFMTLLSALKMLLQRHTGQDDVVVGTPIAGRNRAEIEGLIGFFVNTLVLRTDLGGRPTFRELLGRVREVALGAYTHQDLPFEKLVEELRPERDPSRAPFFQVMFNLVNLESLALELDGLAVEILRNPEPHSKFDLTVYAIDGAKAIELVAVYNADLYESARMADLLAQFEQVLTQAMASPQEPVQRMSLATPRSRRTLPDPALPLERASPEVVTVRFSRQAQRVPSRTAVRDGRYAWSYDQLDLQSSQLAASLRSRGIERGDLVAIYGHRTGSLVCALLGVLKAGAAFVVLDPAHPAARVAECLRLARPRGFVHLAAAGFPGAAVEAFAAGLDCRIDLPAEPPEGPGIDLPAGGSLPEPRPDDQAYVAFTSGSTGTPKGIVGTHRPLSHFLEWHTRHFGLEERDRFSMLSGLAHDPLLRDVFTPLWLGATLTIPHPEVIADGHLGDWMAQEQVTVAHLTPALARLLAEGGKSLPSLRYAFLGGDVLTADDVARLRTRSRSLRCVNYYGATETPQGVGVYEVPDTRAMTPESRGRELVPLGKGIAGVRLLVLGEDGMQAGIGEVGEIHVQTPYLATGYLGDEALTRERFVVDRFSGGGTERLYRTGDLGRYGLDGDVHFVGRRDDQVNLRGFRIEPAEIESALRQHPEVLEAVVVASEDRLGEKRLVAYFSATVGEGRPAPEELHGFLAERLPDYMIPARFIALATLPLSPSGKVDRRALPSPEWGAHPSNRLFAPPRTPVEEILCAIWSELLGVERVGIEDDFFGLGGHSLLGTQFASRVRDQLGIELPLRRLFEKPTIGALAPLVTQGLVDLADEEEMDRVIAEVKGLATVEATDCMHAGGEVAGVEEPG